MTVYWNPYDINHDLKASIEDVGISAKAFGTVPENAFCNPHADITGSDLNSPDGKMDRADIERVARHFGEPYP